MHQNIVSLNLLFIILKLSQLPFYRIVWLLIN